MPTPDGLILRSIDGLVHPTIRAGGLEHARHTAFLAFQLAVGLAALAAIPLHLVLANRPDPSVIAALGLVALAAPIAILVGRCANLTLGHGLAGASIAAALALTAATGGGLADPALLGLTLVPLEAALSGRRNVVAVALATIAVAVAAVAAFDISGFTAHTAPDADTLRLVIVLGLAYIAGLILRMDALHRAAARETTGARHAMDLMAFNVGDIVTLHGANGDIIFAAPGIERLAGVAGAEALGDGFFRRVHVGDRPAFLTALADAMGPIGAATVEFRLRRERDGRVDFPWMEMRCRALAGEHTLVAGAEVVAVMRDISDRRRQEEELRAARATAEEASNAKSRFLATVSHELRTPLNAIIGFSELLDGEICGKFTDPRQKEYVALIHESGTHLLNVVNDILDMSKIEAGKLDLTVEPISVDDMVASAGRMVAHLASEQGLNLKTRVAGGLPDLNADPRACRQILINLLSNAIKFTEPGGRITLAAERDGAHVAFSVADTGIGIAERDLARIGEPFVQAHGGYNRGHAGTGLGLSVVKGLAGLHGGSMRIDSRLGHGTTVTVRLPLSGPAGDHSAAGQRVIALGEAHSPAAASSAADDVHPQQRQRRA
jgi:cell cycle sensor histidine kinase DivJ